MKKKLKEELRKLSTDIITTRDLNEIKDLYEASRALYEKLAVLKFIEEELNDLQVDVSKNAIAAKFEQMATSVMQANKGVPESNPHEEDIMIPGMDTIRHMVSEMPNTEELEAVLTEFMGKPHVMKNDKAYVTPTQEDLAKAKETSKSLNDRFGNKELKVDLNNKLGFIKHLFNNNTEDYNRVISQLNTIDSHERSVAFIQTMVKPDYDHWEGKEEYEKRFMELLERRFA
jgi:hypothetical protein